MPYFHEIERLQFSVVFHYVDEYRDARYCVEFADGEAYLCIFDTAYESENGGELDIEEDDPRYDEFNVLAFAIQEVLVDGPRRYNKFLCVDYRDFPSRITDIDRNVVVYGG